MVIYCDGTKLPVNDMFRCYETDINLEAGDCSERIAKLVSQCVEQHKIGEEYYELKNLLTLVSFEWPALVHWHQKFVSLAYQPRSFPDPQALVIPPEYAAELPVLRNLPASVRNVILQRPFPAPLALFTRKFGEPAVGELRELGFARLVLGTFEKLPYLPLEHLRGIQNCLGLKGGRSRAEAARKITDSAREDEVAALLLPDFQGPIIVVESPFSVIQSGWLGARERVVTSYLLTLNCFLGSIRQIASAKFIGSPILVAPKDSHCPVCLPHVGMRIRPDVDAIPPFHPACTCSLVAERLLGLAS